MAINSGIVPLAVLCSCLLLGGVFAILLTRKIARVRLIQELENAAQAQQEAERLAMMKPELVDVYIQQPKKDLVRDREALLWQDVLPLAAQFNEDLASPHPHRTIEKHPGYTQNPLVDGNVLELSVGIAMPRPPSRDDLDMIDPLQSFEYCIGTSDTVVCSLLGVRPRLLGLN